MRAVGHLRRLLVDRIRHQIEAIGLSLKSDALAVPADLLAEHVVGTFILVLNWWTDTQSPLSPREVDDLFLAFVGPAVVAAGRD